MAQGAERNGRSAWRAGLLAGAVVASWCALMSPTGGAALVRPAMAVPPEPDPVPRRWQLDFAPGDLRIVTIDTPGLGARAYFYLTYRVTNNSGADQLFAPAFDLMTEDGKIARSGRDIPGEVTRQILAGLDNPLIQDQISILGVLLQGRENSKQGVAVWSADELGTDEVTVFAAGFSGETRAVTALDPKTGGQNRSLLRKTMMLRYKVAGDLDRRGSEPFPLIEQRWILR